MVACLVGVAFLVNIRSVCSLGSRRFLNLKPAKEKFRTPCFFDGDSK